MTTLARIPLDGGGSVLIEADSGLNRPYGPVPAGRASDAVHELTDRLGDLLKPVADTAKTVLAQLREAGPDEVEVEFGVDLSVAAGAVITKTETQGHLKVRVLWRGDTPAGPDGPAGQG